jgi:hypothetical protein
MLALYMPFVKHPDQLTPVAANWLYRVTEDLIAICESARKSRSQWTETS